MRIAVFGAGAIGGQIAARLASSGMPISLVARGAHLRAIREDGLALLTDGEMIRVALEASDNPDDFGVQDYVIVAVKGTQLPHAVEALRALIGGRTRALFAMNGLPWWFAEGLPVPMTADLQRCLDPLGNFRAIVAQVQMIWGVVTAGATIVGPGIIRSTTPGANSITLGYPDDRADGPLRVVTDLLARNGYRASIAGNIRDAVWFKLLTNAAQAMVATATNRSHIEVTSDPETRSVIIHVMQELVVIGASMGLNVEADPFEMTSPSRFGEHIPFFLQDLRAGRPLELSSTILAAREIGRASGLSSPHLMTLAAIVVAQSADAARSRPEDQATGPEAPQGQSLVEQRVPRSNVAPSEAAEQPVRQSLCVGLPRHSVTKASGRQDGCGPSIKIKGGNHENIDRNNPVRPCRAASARIDGRPASRPKLADTTRKADRALRRRERHGPCRADRRQ